MVNINTVKDLFSKDLQNIFQNLNTNFGMAFVAVFDIQNKGLISLYVCQSILVPDEQNRKTFLIKGKLINDFSTILQQGGSVTTNGWNSDIKQIVESLPTSTHTYSENMFGFIGFGIQGY